MEKGKRIILSENPAVIRYEAKDAENQEESEWLGNLLSRWITAKNIFDRLPIVEEYHFAFPFPYDKDGQELAGEFYAFRAILRSTTRCKKRRK